jgi:Fatty acid desaturase
MNAMRLAHYCVMNAVLSFNLVLLLIGGPAIWLGLLAAVALATVVDEAAGDDTAPPSASVPQMFLNSLLFATLPLLALNSLALAHLVGAGDPLGWGTVIGWFGFDLTAARAATGPLSTLGGMLGLGLFLGGAGINVAHELVHRTHNPYALAVGRWLLAFSGDTTFAIEHVYGHHRAAATYADAATARRGETLWAFVWRATRDGNRNAFRHEQARLIRKGLPVWSWHNKALTWQLATLAIAASWFLIAGWVGLIIGVLAGIQGKFYLEAVDYIEHFGLVRVPGQPVEPRHSWNSYRRVSNGMLYNLPRHANHHRFATKPYWQLEVEPGSPEMPHGYLSMMVLALVPSVWERVITPKLAQWDATMASDAERALLAERGVLVGHRAAASA